MIAVPIMFVVVGLAVGLVIQTGRIKALQGDVRGQEEQIRRLKETVHDLQE